MVWLDGQGLGRNIIGKIGDKEKYMYTHLKGPKNHQRFVFYVSAYQKVTLAEEDFNH